MISALVSGSVDPLLESLEAGALLETCIVVNLHCCKVALSVIVVIVVQEVLFLKILFFDLDENIQLLC